MISNKTFTTKLKIDLLEALANCIENILTNTEPADLDDKILFASLYEVMIKAKQKLLHYKPIYLVNLSPAQAFACCILGSFYITDVSTQLGNKLLQIQAAVLKQYQ